VTRQQYVVELKQLLIDGMLPTLWNESEPD